MRGGLLIRQNGLTLRGLGSVNTPVRLVLKGDIVDNFDSTSDIKQLSERAAKLLDLIKLDVDDYAYGFVSTNNYRNYRVVVTTRAQWQALTIKDPRVLYLFVEQLPAVWPPYGAAGTRIRATPNRGVIPSGGGTLVSEVSIDNNGLWAATGDNAEQLLITDGQGPGFVMIEAEENLLDRPKVGKVVVSCSAVSTELVYIQAGAVDTPAVYLESDPAFSRTVYTPQVVTVYVGPMGANWELLSCPQDIAVIPQTGATGDLVTIVINGTPGAAITGPIRFANADNHTVYTDL